MSATNNPQIIVLEFELDAIRALRSAPDRNVARAAIDREELLAAELERVRFEVTEKEKEAA